MVCTKEIYTAVATWTISEVANLFKDAFIDAGLMVDWFDSFLSGGVENRILRVQYDAAKAYGTTFYWFKFQNFTSITINIATGWNATTHLPTGTRYLDYFDTVTNSTNTGYSFTPGISTTTTARLTRYTSGINSDQSWFVFETSSQRRAFTIVHPAETLQPWIDLNKGYFSGFYWVIPSTSANMGFLSWGTGPLLRREVIKGCALHGNTDSGEYLTTPSDERILGYAAAGNQLNGGSANYNNNQPYIWLPVGFSSSNPAFTQDSNPIFYGLPYTPYVQSPLADDIGITFHYATNNFAVGDTFVVSPGVEEWEVMDFLANGSPVTGASPLFLARVV
jgi:hypothetical protein